MDPLSVTASIVGILAAAAKIGESLHGTISTAKDAPQVLTALDCEVREFQAALSSLQVLLLDLSSASPHRTALVQVDHLIATLTECVLTFSELETTIVPFASLRGPKVPLRTRLKWTRAESDCLKILERLQRHKSTISLMLNIFQCASDAEASRSQSTLEAMVEQLLLSNRQLCRRLRNLEDVLDASSFVARGNDNASLFSRAESTTSATRRLSARETPSMIKAISMRYAFEDDLESSRVYRMVKKDACDHSLISSAIRTQTWSIFSGLSLAEISNISVVALPLYVDDIKDGGQYRLLPAHESGYEGQIAVHSENVSSAIDGTGLPVLAFSDRINARDGPWIDKKVYWGVPADNISHVDLISAFNIPLESTTAKDSGVLPVSATRDSLGTELVDVVETESNLHRLDDADDSSSSVRPVHMFYDPTVEGRSGFDSVYECFAIELYRCIVCNNTSHVDDLSLLLQDSSAVCENCMHCSQCGSSLYDPAVFSKFNAVCTQCLRCRDCGRLIDTFRYALTTEGVCCLDCYDSGNYLEPRSAKREMYMYQITVGKSRPIELSEHADLNLGTTSKLPPPSSRSPSPNSTEDGRQSFAEWLDDEASALAYDRVSDGSVSFYSVESRLFSIPEYSTTGRIIELADHE
ncbi:hypothetical protein CC86DRAFT_401453 [Ophiobolus disseminans]|uniref:Azaphilone pigments biosynthesis cluster protein L N-terminal domain-containing protein n=1 Tax=Ophiobolus disseminans TaxID=1469910 RepID=A0A6A7AHL3_9PLEO|nr:hypothetical protein CC86DRAFT_401453 [Ophiobolus disseminans]